MDGLVIGNQIQCYSPAAKEVPRIITENGEQSPEAKLGGKSFLMLPGPRELRTDAGDWGGGSTQEGRVGGKGVPWWGCSRKTGMECPSTAFGIETG